VTLEGAALATLGRVDEGVARIESGIAEYQGLRTPPVFWPLLLYIRAGGLALSGLPADGLELLEEAIGIVGEDNLQYPVFALLQGDLLLGMADAEGAEARFRRAFDVALGLGLRTPRLRAATRLAQLRPADWAGSLRDVYETFTDGVETPDLVEARSLLDEIDAHAG
jgi:hypothetical protein